MDASEMKDRRSSSGAVSERLSKIKDRGMKKKAIRRFLDDRNISISNRSDDFLKNVASSLDSDEFTELLDQYKFAGQQTLNYFVVLGIGHKDWGRIDDELNSEFSSRDELEEDVKTPYFVYSETMGDRYYGVFGYEIGFRDVDPETGARTRKLGSKRAILVIKEDSDLIEIRASDRGLANSIKDGIANALGMNEGSFYTPDFDNRFQEKFNEEVKKYTSLKVRTKNEEDSTVSNIRFTAGKDDSGDREDAREDDRVARELGDEGSTITMGYAELKEGLKFNINRNQSKISLQKYEMEDLLNEITELIDNVLGETGGYSQSTLSEIDNVPE